MKPNERQFLLPLRPRRKRVTVKADGIRIYKRKESKYWQAAFRINGQLHRITTGTTLSAAAIEYATLALRHLSK